MSQKRRVVLGLVLLGLVLAGVLLVDFFQRNRLKATVADLPPGSIPIYYHGELIASFTPVDLENLAKASFVDVEEGKTQDGWLLKDVLELNLGGRSLEDAASITVSSSSREKSHTLTWADVSDPENMVMFDLSGRSTLKLVSKMEGFDLRDSWVQDVDRIEIQSP
jgi:hypothetical protein